MDSRVWFITGASRGMGASFARSVLAHGDYLIATARNPESVTQALGEHDNLLPLALDVTDKDSVNTAVQTALDTTGHIDVLLNNAGYGIFGAFEEISDEEFRAIFETNFFGSLNVIRAVLPSMRKLQNGRIINLSSGAAFSPDPGGSAYDSAKMALMGVSEVLTMEMKPFGIESMAICPGMIRTEFFRDNSMKVPANLMPEYAGTPARGALEYCQANDGLQFGDPDKVAEFVYEVATAEEPMPAWLPIGKDAMKKWFRTLEKKEAKIRPYFDRASAVSFPREQ